MLPSQFKYLHLFDTSNSTITFQVDYKSYLLDFKSLSNEEAIDATNENGFPAPNQFALPIAPVTNTVPCGGHHTMEFFEMCAALIIQLAR